ncbi:MAG: hypothetical protein PF489_02480 [Salinivirgaceae bacterium]|jgi:hypothetical protein|nr:hypothetical protein [Salinivirgaceae bacterium]
MTTEKNDKTNEKQNRETNDDNSFWEDTRENVTEGARIVGEEARRIGGQISSYSEKIFGKVSDSATDAYKISTEFTRDAVNGAQALAEKYKDKYEINKLNNKKKEISTQLGMKLYLEVKNNDNRIPRGFLDKNEIQGLVSKLESLDQEIIDITEEDEKTS